MNWLTTHTPKLGMRHFFLFVVLICLAASLPRLQYFFLASTDKSDASYWVSWGMALVIDGGIATLSWMAMNLKLTHWAVGLGWVGLQVLILGSVIFSFLVNLAYIAHNNDPSMLSGAQGYPWAGLYPYMQACPPWFLLIFTWIGHWYIGQRQQQQTPVKAKEDPYQGMSTEQVLQEKDRQIAIERKDRELVRARRARVFAWVTRGEGDEKKTEPQRQQQGQEESVAVQTPPPSSSTLVAGEELPEEQKSEPLVQQQELSSPNVRYRQVWQEGTDQEHTTIGRAATAWGITKEQLRALIDAKWSSPQLAPYVFSYEERGKTEQHIYTRAYSVVQALSTQRKREISGELAIVSAGVGEKGSKNGRH